MTNRGRNELLLARLMKLQFFVHSTVLLSHRLIGPSVVTFVVMPSWDDFTHGRARIELSMPRARVMTQSIRRRRVEEGRSALGLLRVLCH